MNQARRAFERFEKSDSWLPFILLSLLGVTATIACIVATRGQRTALGLDMCYLIGESMGKSIVLAPNLRELETEASSPVELKSLSDVEGWGNGFTFIEAFGWDLNPEGKPSDTEESLLKSYCWLSEDQRKLLVLSMASYRNEKGKPSSEKLVGAKVVSEEKETGQYLETASTNYLPSAPWESLVSLENGTPIKPADLFAAHGQHVADKELKEFRATELKKFLEQSIKRKAYWLVSRGGLSSQEIEFSLAGLKRSGTIAFTEKDRAAYSLGVRGGMAQQATFLALAAYRETIQNDDLSDLVVLHKCPCAIELEMQVEGLGGVSALISKKPMSSERLARLVDEALIAGINLQTRVDEIVTKLQSEQFASKVHQLDEPIEATIYKLNKQKHE